MSIVTIAPREFDEIVRQDLDPATQEAYMATAEMIHKRGYDQGREEGYDQGRRSMLLQQLRARFGPLPAAIEERVRTAAPEQLDIWTCALLRASTLDDVFVA
jgi:hypothetical protein